MRPLPTSRTPMSGARSGPGVVLDARRPRAFSINNLRSPTCHAVERPRRPALSAGRQFRVPAPLSRRRGGCPRSLKDHLRRSHAKRCMIHLVQQALGGIERLLHAVVHEAGDLVEY